MQIRAKFVRNVARKGQPRKMVTTHLNFATKAAFFAWERANRKFGKITYTDRYLR